MLKAPTAYNPRINPERAFAPTQYGDQSDGEVWLPGSEVADSVRQIPVLVDYNLASHLTGNARHFRTFLAGFMNNDKPEPPGVNAGNLALERYMRDSLRWANDPLYGWINKSLQTRWFTVRPLQGWAEDLYHHQFQNAAVCRRGSGAADEGLSAACIFQGKEGKDQCSF